MKLMHIKSSGAFPVLLLLTVAPVYADHIDYEDIYPLLEERCLNCHHNPGAPNDLSLETYDLMMQGGINGAVVIPGNSGNSEIIKRVRGERHPRMPLNGPPFLNEEELALLADWIDSGALAE
jgi:hypothetical protein